jgi:hypothetical protein
VIEAGTECINRFPEIHVYVSIDVPVYVFIDTRVYAHIDKYVYVTIDISVYVIIDILVYEIIYIQCRWQLTNKHESGPQGYGPGDAGNSPQSLSARLGFAPEDRPQTGRHLCGQLETGK